MTEELALGGADLRAPDWRADDVAPGRDFRVAIVGAGMSGIAVGAPARAGRRRLRDPREERRRRRHLAGEPVPGVPGRRARTTSTATRSRRRRSGRSTSPPSRACSTTSARARPSSASASTCASTPRWSTRPGTTTRGVWRDRGARAPTGTDTVEAHALVSAVGQLNRPNLPDIPGIDTLRAAVGSTRPAGIPTSSSTASASRSSAPARARRSSSPRSPSRRRT